MQIILTEDLEQQLQEYACAHSIKTEILVVEVLREWCGMQNISGGTQSEPQNLADFLGEYIGAVSSKEIIADGAQMSTGYKKRISEGIMAKKQQGRL